MQVGVVDRPVAVEHAAVGPVSLARSWDRADVGWVVERAVVPRGKGTAVRDPRPRAMVLEGPTPRRGRAPGRSVMWRQSRNPATPLLIAGLPSTRFLA